MSPPTNTAEQSVFVFESHLTPWEACVNLNFDNLRLAPDFVAACTRDHLMLLTARTPTVTVPFDFILNRARDLAQRLIDAHAFYCRANAHLLEQEPTIWVEMRGVVRAEAVHGYMHRSLGFTQLNPDHDDNAAVRVAGALVNRWGRVPALMLALSDFRTARRELGPYYAFHTFRTLEDIRDAFLGEERGQRWDAMNAALGTARDSWAELTEASTRARHLNPADLVWLGDADRHERLLDQMRDALRMFIAYLPTLVGASAGSGR